MAYLAPEAPALAVLQATAQIIAAGFRSNAAIQLRYQATLNGIGPTPTPPIIANVKIAVWGPRLLTETARSVVAGEADICKRFDPCPAHERREIIS